MMTVPVSRRFLGLPIMAAAVGIGLAFYFGERCYQLAQVSEADFRASTELNLLLDLQRAGPPAPAGAALDARRQQVRHELQAQFDSERRDAWRGLAASLVGGALGLGMLYAQLRPSGLARRD